MWGCATLLASIVFELLSVFQVEPKSPLFVAQAPMGPLQPVLTDEFAGALFL